MFTSRMQALQHKWLMRFVSRLLPTADRLQDTVDSSNQRSRKAGRRVLQT